MTARLRTAHWGTFDAERWWRPAELAALPAVAAPGRRAGVAAMDELLASFCAPSDLLVTRFPMALALRETLAEAGITFEQHTIDPGAAPVPGREPPPGPARYPDATAESLILADPTALEQIGACEKSAPYAVLADTGSLAERLGRADRLPSAAAAASANSKSWSNELVHDLGLFGAGRLVRSVEDLGAAIAEYGYPAVVKDPYGVSGRAALEVATPGMLAAVQRTLRRQTAAGKRVELLVQRRYARQCDFSGHLHVDSTGGWTTFGVQIMDNRGFRFAGSRPADSGFLDLLAAEGYFEILSHVASALAGVGYWGPAGIDSMLLDDGTLLPVLEVNARQSLGLLAMHLQDRAREQGLHCHLWQMDLAVRPGSDIEDLCAALLRDGCLYGGGPRPGATVLSGSMLSEPGGRVFCALFHRAGEAGALQRRVLAAATTAGLVPREPRGVPDAA